MKRFFLTFCALAISAGAAAAQVNVVPATGLNTEYLRKATYSAAFVGLVPAASATDLICISGSSTKTVRLQSIRLSGSAGTLVTLPVTLLRRASLDTGGTAATTTANPANTISKRDPGNAAATATLISYTANPTIVDSAPTYIDSQSLTLPVTSAGTVTVPLLFDFNAGTTNLLQQPTLTATTQQICVNLNAVSVSSGLINGSVTWTEE